MTHVILSDDSNIRVDDVPCQIDIISTPALTISWVNVRNSLTASLFSVSGSSLIYCLAFNVHALTTNYFITVITTNMGAVRGSPT